MYEALASVFCVTLTKGDKLSPPAGKALSSNLTLSVILFFIPAGN